MPQRITKTDEAYVHKQLKRPHDASGNVFEIRRIVLNNLGHKVYLMYGVENPPDFDDVDDEWDETSGAEKDYITAGLYLKADDAKKAGSLPTIRRRRRRPARSLSGSGSLEPKRPHASLRRHQFVLARVRLVRRLQARRARCAASTTAGATPTRTS
jgi:hypothetical protein